MTETMSLAASAGLLAEGESPLDSILAQSHPLMVEAFYLAAIPQWYDAALLAALRQRPDGREAGLLERLTRYSFVSPLARPPMTGQEPASQGYCVRAAEREALQRRWLAEDPAAYRAAHGRALAFWEEHPDPNPFALAQNRLYHLLFVDFQAAVPFLLDRFRTYRDERQLPAIERLLGTVGEAQALLARLDAAAALNLGDLLAYLELRLAQLRGDWSAASQSLEALSRRLDTLEPSLRPYVLRAQGESLVHAGHYADAITCLRRAWKEFSRPEVAASAWGLIEAERGHTLLALGDAHLELAASVGGRSPAELAHEDVWHRLRPGLYFLVSLPLVLYLSLYLGRRVWHPHFWPVFAGLDWMVARLLASAADAYRQADRVLEKHGTPAEGQLADERLAALALNLGDARGAQQRCVSLLRNQERAPLAPHRQAIVQVMLADALLRLGQPAQAVEPLRAALAVLATYGDRRQGARTRELLGLALLRLGQEPEAVGHLAVASRRFQEEGLWVEATRLVERLESWPATAAKGPGSQAVAEIAAGLDRRQYPGIYRHPLLLLFRRVVLAALPFVLLLLPLFSLVFDTSTTLRPEIHFRPVPKVLLVSTDEDPLALQLDLSQGVRGANVSEVTVSKALLQTAGGIALGYLLVSMFLGLAAIVLTPLRSVEARGQGATVVVDDRHLTTGPARREAEGAEHVSLPWGTVSRFVPADTCLWQRSLADRSALGLLAGGQRVVIPGSTAWYPGLRAQVERHLPAGVEVLNRDVVLFPSRMGLLYVLNLGLLLALVVLAGLGAEAAIFYDLPGTPYSAADLYPYLLLGLVVPPLWWAVFQPLRQRVTLWPHSRQPLLFLGVGLLLLAVQILFRFRPLLTVVNLHVPLITLGVLFSATWALWRAEENGHPVHPWPLRVGTALAVLLATLLLGTVVVRDAWAYHALVQGNAERDRAARVAEGEERQALLDAAVASYGWAAAIGSTPIWGLDTRPAVSIPVGVPPPRLFTWLLAKRSQAAIQVQLGHYPQAIENCGQVLAWAELNDTVYALRALARLSQGTGLAAGGGLAVDTTLYQQALQDLKRAMDLYPQAPTYALWRGLAHHALSHVSYEPGQPPAGQVGALGEAYYYYRLALQLRTPRGASLRPDQQERALTGLGWIAYARGRREEALSYFERAVVAQPGAYEAWLAKGYSLYDLDRFEEAQPAWERAIYLEPEDPILHISLGALHWKLGTVHSAGSGPPSEFDCAERARSYVYFQTAARGDGLWPQAAADRAFAYRAAAQMQYLRVSCPDMDATTAYEQAVSLYGSALDLDPDNPAYWYRQGRLAQVLSARHWPADPTEARTWLATAIDALGHAIALAPQQVVYLHDQAWMLYLAWDWSAAPGLAEQAGLLQARSNLKAALALDAGDRGRSYRPNYWLGVIEPLAVSGGLNYGASLWAAGDDAAALDAYELVANQVPDSAPAAFGAGLAALGLDDGERALAWYASGLERAAGDPATAENALAALVLAVAGGRVTTPGPILELFEDSGIRPQAHEPRLAFALSWAALDEGDEERYVDFSNLGLELAAAAGDMAAVRAGAGALRDHLLQHPALDPAAVYWPLADDEQARAQAVAALPHPDLYWRYRAEFGFRLLGDRLLMLARPANDRPYEAIMHSVAADMERAVALNPTDDHRQWRDFYVDAGIGWVYLRRGDDRVQSQDYEHAVADYELASLRIEPASRNAALDLLESLFKAGLNALRLGQVERAGRLYGRAFDLLRDKGDAFGLALKVAPARDDLQALLAAHPDLAPTASPFLDELIRLSEE